MTDIGPAVKEIRTGALILRPDDRGGWIVDGHRAEWVMLDGSAVDATNPADDRALQHAVAAAEWNRITWRPQ